jgi:uncharacterized protein YceH (UPF0502 family)
LNLLNEAEVRVLGALVEKDITTPDYYPLSLNALINACNQKNNRDPVMSLDETTVRAAVSGLQDKGLAGTSSSADSRVTKYEHRLQEIFNFSRPETALLGVLLLRGPQTLGELRGRTERMYRFTALDEVQSALQRMIQRDPPLVKVLPRQPGTKEARYMHLLAGTKEEWQPAAQAESGASIAPAMPDRMTQLEHQLSSLRDEIAAMREELAAFRKQFQ